MNERNGENLKELFEQFYTCEEAEKAAQEIEAGESILRENPAPEPRMELLLGIKTQIIEALHRRRRRQRFIGFAFKLAAAAAVVIILANLWIGLRKDRSSDSQLTTYASLVPAAFWESENIASDDSALAFFTTEIEQIESEVKALLLGERSNDETGVDELEMELLEIENDFWKE